MDSAAHRRYTVLVSVALLLAAFFALTFIHHANLGIGHFFYLPILLFAAAAGPRWGIAFGLVGAALYDVAVYVNPAIPWVDVVPQTALRAIGFCVVGGMVGWYARRNQGLVEELTRLANRDQLTGLPNTRAFEDAIARRLAEGRPFALVVGDVDELRTVNGGGRDAGDDALRRLADRLATMRRGDEVARIGGDEFAVLAELTPDGARGIALALEAALASTTFGWATFPDDGENALALYRVADERLYARKLARGYRRGFEHAVS
ncbi:MAG TPA: GGDEF domain-containing protein [Gaiellaceae bacterium]